MRHRIERVTWIYAENQRLLSTRTRGKNIFYTPGGKPEAGETDEMALIREIREELGVQLVPETIALYGRFEAQADGQPQGVMVNMLCYTAKYTGHMCACGEIEEVTWLEYHDHHKSSLADRQIFTRLQQEGLLA
ncbi:MAG: NUDIX domain-containing protein [Ktedonobacteraceae bacterium]